MTELQGAEKFGVFTPAGSHEPSGPPGTIFKTLSLIVLTKLDGVTVAVLTVCWSYEAFEILKYQEIL